MNRYILIIDDDPISNFILENLIKNVGSIYNTIICMTNTDDGLEFMIKNKEAILILFLDLNMPKLDGWDLISLVRKENLITYPVYIVSSSINDSDLNHVADFDEIYGYLVKPINKESINKILSEHNILG